MAILWQAGTLPWKPAEKIGGIKLTHHLRDEAGAARGGHCWGTSTIAGAFRRCHQGWPRSIRMQAQPQLSVLACGDLGPSSFLTCSKRLLPLPCGLSGTFCTTGGQLQWWRPQRNVTFLLWSWPRPVSRLIKEFVWFPQFKGLSKGCCLDFKILVKISGKMEDLTQGLFLKVRADGCYVHMTPVIIATNNW